MPINTSEYRPGITPDTAIKITRQHNPDYTWEGPFDPGQRGFLPCNILVTVYRILPSGGRGILHTGEACLGGSYYQEDEGIGDVHGYLDDLILEAMAEMVPVR